MRTLSLNDDRTLTLATTALQEGEAIVVPTDTVYGLAARPDLPAAVHRIYLAKDRPAQMHLPVLAANLDQVGGLGVDLSEDALILADRWWPGPLTMALGFRSPVARPDWLVGRDEVAVRIPQHPFLLSLMAQTGVLVVTSANRHGSPTPPSAEEASQQLAPHVTLMIDGGTLEGAPSTLVNLRGGKVSVEREGAIARTSLASALARPVDAL